jgi:transcriptional regulator with XRE-family HTH domain
LEAQIVQKINELRRARNLTLDKLADLTGLTKGYLSRIENSQKSPPVSTLSKIAGALGVDITEFFSHNSTSPELVDMTITRKGERLKIGDRQTPYGYIYEAMAYRMIGKNMEPYVLTIDNEIYDYDQGFQHIGEEFLYVLEGKLEHHYEGKTYILEKGDSVYFDASKHHYGRSIGMKKAKVLCIIFSYKRI